MKSFVQLFNPSFVKPRVSGIRALPPIKLAISDLPYGLAPQSSPLPHCANFVGHYNKINQTKTNPNFETNVEICKDLHVPHFEATWNLRQRYPMGTRNVCGRIIRNNKPPKRPQYPILEERLRNAFGSAEDSKLTGVNSKSWIIRKLLKILRNKKESTL